MTTQRLTFVTTSRSDSKYIGRNLARKFWNPNFQSLIREVWFVIIVIHYHGEVSGIERNKTYIFFGHGVAGIAPKIGSKRRRSSLFFLPLPTRPPQRARRSGGESKYGDPISGGRTWVLVEFRVF